MVDRRSEDECWPFLGARVPAGGYGRVLFKGTLMAAHRAAYIIATGQVPAGLDVMHHCDNPPCCNPAHLEAVTTLENMQDAKRKRRHAHGERGRAKLTEEQVREILSLKGTISGNRLCLQYGVHAGCIHAIWRGDSWAHLQEAA